MRRTLFPGISGAVFSKDKKHRYALWRVWDAENTLAMFIGLNPSTADEIENDPTVTRCIERSKQMGYGGLLMGNIFAFRATDPGMLLVARDPVGPETDGWLLHMARNAGVIIAAWDTHGKYLERSHAVCRLLKKYPLMCLKTTKHGHPQHPLYLSYKLKLFIRVRCRCLYLPAKVSILKSCTLRLPRRERRVSFDLHPSSL